MGLVGRALANSIEALAHRLGLRLDRAGRGVAENDRKAPASLSSTPGASPPLLALLGELFTAEQLELHARLLATEQRVGRVAHPTDRLRPLVDRSERTLRRSRTILAQGGQQSRILTPAAAWLLDNAYLIEEQVREVRVDLPEGYYKELPKLVSGPFVGYPRIFAIALELIAHTDARIDAEQLVRFILSYEAVTPLTMGELWATAIMLRIGLILNLGRLSEIILAAHESRAEADRWTDRLLAEVGTGPAAPAAFFDSLRDRYPRLPAPFAARLLWRLQSDEPRPPIAALIERIERQLTDEYGGVEAVYHLEHKTQAANQAAVSNTITSMRTLSTIDWDAWFERVSWTEQTLRGDPSETYGRSTFATRDRYRHVVERLARRTGLDEVEVARRAVALASRAPRDAAERARHVGAYLVGDESRAFERDLGYPETPDERLRRALTDHPTATYFGALALTGGALVAGGIAAAGLSRRSRRAAVAAALLGLPLSEVAVEAVNWGLSFLLTPRVLPRLDLDGGIPEELRTIVVVPMLLLTPRSVRGQLERLEVLSLAHGDPRLHFALLSDFADAPVAEMPEDAELLDVAARGIEELNRRYGSDRFLLLHRRRLWNPGQSRFMGWERKRGKLIEFNRLLAGATDTSFVTRVGDESILRSIRYVITLDADTQLPRDAAHALIGTIAHPLNQAVIDPRSSRVVSGYGILQPRVSTALPSANQSRFARVFSGTTGLDPYATAVSNAYMDLFGEGIYAGKGIYDPRVLGVVLDDRFPDNALLSHDLIEGNYARVGFLSDVELLDAFPTTYSSYMQRQHRWVRGDWQIAPWLLPWAPTPKGEAENPLSAIARFKIFDNLRRSLVAPSSVLLLGAGAAFLPGRQLVWVAGALLPLATPLLLSTFDRALTLSRSRWKRAVLHSTAGELRFVAARFAIGVAILPDEAATNVDAISRTLYRQLISRRDLLQWETFEQTERQAARPGRRLIARQVGGAGLLAGLGWLRPGGGLGRLASGGVIPPADGHLARALDRILSALWLAAPALTRWLDRPLDRPRRVEDHEDRAFLRWLARSYWRYFETFVTAEGNYLAPDNFQEVPHPVVAYRTSPTNVGLQALADLAARDFGYLGVLDLTERTERIFATLRRLERFQGHFLNWYDTATLQTLPPAYVSTVDSGNLAGHLLTLAQGYRELLDRPIVGPWILDGLADVLALREGDAPAVGPGVEALMVPPPISDSLSKHVIPRCGSE